MGQHLCGVQGCHGTAPLVGSRDVMGQHRCGVQGCHGTALACSFEKKVVYVFPTVFHLEKDDSVFVFLTVLPLQKKKRNVFSLCSLYRKRAVCIFLTVLLLEQDGSPCRSHGVPIRERYLGLCLFRCVPLEKDISVFLFHIVFPA